MVLEGAGGGSTPGPALPGRCQRSTALLALAALGEGTMGPDARDTATQRTGGPSPRAVLCPTPPLPPKTRSDATQITLAGEGSPRCRAGWGRREQPCPAPRCPAPSRSGGEGARAGAARAAWGQRGTWGRGCTHQLRLVPLVQPRLIV